VLGNTPGGAGPTVLDRLRRHDLVGAYLAIVLLTWAVWVPRALGFPMGVVGQVSVWFPAIAVLVWAGVVHDWPGVRDLGRRLVRWRVRWWWYPVVLVGPWIFSLAVTGVSGLLGVRGNEATPVLPATVGAVLLLLTVLALTDGLGEEVAWRGYLLPRLLNRHGVLAASLILAAAWWLWHLPLLWTDGVALGGEPWWLLLANLTTLSVVFTFVFLHTRGSVLIAILLHAACNLCAVSPDAGPGGDMTVALVALGLKAVVAVGCLMHLSLVPPLKGGPS
jgi:membrane protease YdiL (CAAX protease family)